MKTFYMVYVQGGKAPQIGHDSPEEAEKEARRLAAFEGKVVYVLKTIAAFHVAQQPITKVELE